MRGRWRQIVAEVRIAWLILVVLASGAVNLTLVGQEEKTQASDLKKIEYSEETLQETQSQLDEIETTIEALQQENKQLNQKALQKRREIKKVERSLDQQSRLSRLYDYKLHNTELEVGQVREDLAHLNREIATQQAKLQLQLQHIELLGREGTSHRLMVRGSDAVNECFVVKMIARRNGENLRQQLGDQAMLQELLEEIGTSHQQTEIVSEKTREEQKSREKQLESQLHDLELVLRSKQKKQEEMVDLQERQRRIAQIVRLLMQQKTAREQAEAASQLLVAEDGTLPWPCTAPLVRGFSKDTKDEAAYNPGVDLALPQGSEIRVVASGVVLYAKAFKGYDNLVIVDHGGGMCSLYAFLDKILVTQGETVEKDAVLGLSGLLEGNWGPGVHFELRKDGEAIDPRVWFEAASGAGSSGTTGN